MNLELRHLHVRGDEIEVGDRVMDQLSCITHPVTAIESIVTDARNFHTGKPLCFRALILPGDSADSRPYYLVQETSTYTVLRWVRT